MDSLLFSADAPFLRREAHPVGDVRGEERTAPAIGPHRSVSQFDLACVLGREYRGRDKRTINGLWGKNQLFVWEFAGGRNRAVSVENSGGKLAASREIFEALINLALVVDPSCRCPPRPRSRGPRGPGTPLD